MVSAEGRLSGNNGVLPGKCLIGITFNFQHDNHPKHTPNAVLFARFNKSLHLFQEKYKEMWGGSTLLNITIPQIFDIIILPTTVKSQTNKYCSMGLYSKSHS